MAQLFITTYNQQFKAHPIHKRELMRPRNSFTEQLPFDGNWIVKESIWDSDESMEAALVEIRKMYLRKYITVYRDHFCKMKVEGELQDEIPENMLLESCRKIFENPDQPLLPPLPSARKLFGYMNPKDFKIKKTTYQQVHGRLAFKLLDARYRAARQLSVPELKAQLGKTNLLEGVNNSPIELGDQRRIEYKNKIRSQLPVNRIWCQCHCTC